MKVVTLTDLDGVHFQSRRDCPVNLELEPAALGSGFLPSAFSTPVQSAFLKLLMAGSLVVPVTARPVESFKRVLLPFKGYAICSFGGVILTPEGMPEPHWHRHIAREAQLLSGVFCALKRRIERCRISGGITFSVSLIGDAGCDLYINCKLDGTRVEGSTLSRFRQLLSTCLPQGWRLHDNGNNFALLPPFLSKERAVEYFLRELAPPHDCLIGIGDSRSDLGFMALCDYVVTPTRSQIFAMLTGSQSSERT